MAEQKAVCGGFLVGDGLKMEGKVLSAEGGSGGSVHYVECHTNDQLENIQCELSPEEIIDLVKNGENVVLKVFTTDMPVYVPYYISSVSMMEVMTFIMFDAILVDGSLMSNERIAVQKTPAVTTITGQVTKYTLTPVTP